MFRRWKVALKYRNRHPKKIKRDGVHSYIDINRKGDDDMQKKIFAERYDAVVANIELNSPYKRINGESKYMTAAAMGKLLGVKKTERYRLLHKHYFEWEELFGEYRINIQSFENWYANQVKYKKITGEEPGNELKKWTISPQEIADLLDVNKTVVYELLKKNKIEVIIVDHQKRIPKAAFYQWYDKQSHYRTAEDRKKDEAIIKATISMPEMAKLLGVTRSVVYSIIKSPKYKEMFEIIIVAGQKRITKKASSSFWNPKLNIFWKILKNIMMQK